jgi:FAD/FMN-containing dehydrogenase
MVSHSSSSPDNFAARAHAAKSAVVDAAALAVALRRRVRGEVRFDNGSRALYATDGSNYRQVPIGVVLPRDVDDVLATVSLAREYGAPVLCRGAGTSLAGQTCNVAVVLDFSKYMSGILEIDPVRRIARARTPTRSGWSARMRRFRSAVRSSPCSH